MTPVDVAELLEHYVRKVQRIRPACHRNPHAFLEDKSDVIGEMLADVRRFRTAPRAAPDLKTFRPGTITGPCGRTIRVEIRRKAS